MVELVPSLIDHMNVPVSHLARSVAFYEAALAPLGIGTVFVRPADTGQKAMHAFGVGYRPFFFLVDAGREVRHDADTHVAFTAVDRATVDAFWVAALGAGATARRAPGLCPEYHRDYYAAFVADPDGVNLEAVCHSG